MEHKNWAAVDAVVHSTGAAAIDLDARLKIQDAFGGASVDEIKGYFQGLETAKQRTLFTWAAFTCLSPEAAVDVLKVTVLDRLIVEAEDELIVAFDERMAVVNAKEQQLDHDRLVAEGEVKALRAELAAARESNQRLVRSENDLRAQVQTLHAQAGILREENARLAEIEAAVKLLKSL